MVVRNGVDPSTSGFSDRFRPAWWPGDSWKHRCLPGVL